MRKPHPAIREAQLWLLEHLGTEPRRLQELIAAAAEDGITEKDLKKAGRRLPILRRPDGLRSPWVWHFPEDDQQVLVKYRCPLQECPPIREGWIPFGVSRPIFLAGLLSYQVRGRVQRTRPPGTEGHLLDIKPSPPDSDDSSQT